jgi:hypothetical protein
MTRRLIVPYVPADRKAGDKTSRSEHALSPIIGVPTTTAKLDPTGRQKAAGNLRCRQAFLSIAPISLSMQEYVQWHVNQPAVC